MARFEAPSGLVAELRKLRGGDLIAMANADDAGVLGAFSHALTGCWLETIDPGPYPWVQAGTQHPEWDRLLKGDIVAAMVHLRRHSLPDGDQYAFPVRCEGCGEQYTWEIELSQHLRVQPLAPESAARFRSGQPFEAQLPDGRVVRYGLQVARQDNLIARLQKQQGRLVSVELVDQTAAQITSVDGLEETNIRTCWELLQGLDMDVLMNLRAEMDAADCGVDTAVETRCPARGCGWKQEQQVPFGRRFFRARTKTRTGSVPSRAPREPCDGSS